MGGRGGLEHRNTARKNERKPHHPITQETTANNFISPNTAA